MSFVPYTHNQAVNGTAFPRRLWLCSKAARYLSVSFMMNSRWTLLFVLLLSLLPSSVALGRSEIPSRTGRLTDVIHLFNSEQSKSLSRLLSNYGVHGAINPYVLIIKTLGGESITEYASRVVSAWHLPGGPDSKAILIVIAFRDEQLRIQVATGLKTISEHAIGQIISKIIVPNFEREDYRTGLIKALARLQKLAQSDSKANKSLQPTVQLLRSRPAPELQR